MDAAVSVVCVKPLTPVLSLSGEQAEESDDSKICWICYGADSEEYVAPCACKGLPAMSHSPPRAHALHIVAVVCVAGGLKFVHQRCIKEWCLRNINHQHREGGVPTPVCPTCKTRYQMRYEAIPAGGEESEEEEEEADVIEYDPLNPGPPSVLSLAKPMAYWLWGIELPRLKRLRRRDPDLAEDLAWRCRASASVLLLHAIGLCALAGDHCESGD